MPLSCVVTQGFGSQTHCDPSIPTDTRGRGVLVAVWFWLRCFSAPTTWGHRRTQQTCRHCCGKCCSSPARSGTPAPGRRRRRSAWPHPSRPEEEEPASSLSCPVWPATTTQPPGSMAHPPRCKQLHAGPPRGPIPDIRVGSLAIQLTITRHLTLPRSAVVCPAVFVLLLSSQHQCHHGILSLGAPEQGQITSPGRSGK